MELIYRTVDGKDFTTKDAALQHEANLKKGLKMWDGEGKRTLDVSNALVLSVANEDCMELFHQMCKEYAEKAGSHIDWTGGLEKDIYGYFIWNTGSEQYEWLDDDLIRGIVSLAREEGFV